MRKQLEKLNALYESFQTHATFLNVTGKTGQPLLGDAAVCGLLRDHILTGYLTRDELATHPSLNGMFDACESMTAVQEWLDILNKDHEGDQDEKNRKLNGLILIDEI